MMPRPIGPLAAGPLPTFHASSDCWRCAASASIAARRCRRSPSVPPNSEQILASSYSYRLMRNFATRGYRSDFAAVTGPLTLISGADDELMLADKYADAVHAVAPSVEVKL